MIHLPNIRRTVILFGLTVTTASSVPLAVSATEYSAMRDIESHIQTLLESASLVHSLHYRMVFRNAEVTRELEFWLKDSKYRAVAPKVHMRHSESTIMRPLSQDDPADQRSNDENRSIIYTVRRDGTSPCPIGLPHQTQFGWLFDDPADCRWSLIQNLDLWNRALHANHISATQHVKTFDGLNAHVLILHDSRLGYRLDVWFVDSLGMYPMKVESIEAKGTRKYISVVEKYEIVNIGDRRTVIPTRVREMRTSPILTDDPTYNVFEIIDGSLEINPDLPDELFAETDEFPAEPTESVEPRPNPVRDYHQVPATDLEPIQAVTIDRESAPHSNSESKTGGSHIPATACLVTAAVACIGWTMNRRRSRNTIA